MALMTVSESLAFVFKKVYKYYRTILFFCISLQPKS